jgi:putative hydrolase of the HAD superfamily
MTLPRALLVDLDGVLRQFPAHDVIERQAKLPPGAILEAAFAQTRLTAALTGIITDEEWRAEVARELQLRHPACAAAAAVQGWSSEAGHVDAGVLASLRRARQRARIVLVTNATTRLSADLDRLGLRGELDVIVSSAAVGVAKPAARFFQLALELARVPPSGAFFVDDGERNVAAARSLGIASLCFSALPALERALESQGFIEPAAG